ncbi:MAG: hypothetical protein AB7Q81_23685 [Gammaproteobacteria bacterium]
MKTKTLSTLLASALLLASFASMAADTHHCKSDQKWDTTKAQCVKK